MYLRLDAADPWMKVCQETLNDSREMPDPIQLTKIPIKPTVARYARFQLQSFYGNGGGLQYFSVLSGESSVLKLFELIDLPTNKLTNTH